MRQKSLSRKDPAEKAIRDIRRKPSQRNAAEDKIRVVRCGLLGEGRLGALLAPGARRRHGGEQHMLGIGRALMPNPRRLLMDEPSMGLAPIIVEEIARIIQEISAQGVPVVLVEQNAELALDLADYAYVLETGNLALEGPANELHDNEHVRAAYLGV